MTIFGFCQYFRHLLKRHYPLILAPAAKVVTRKVFNKNSTEPYEAIESWKGPLAQFFDEQEAKQCWRHYPTLTTLTHLVLVPSEYRVKARGLLNGSRGSFRSCGEGGSQRNVALETLKKKTCISILWYWPICFRILRAIRAKFQLPSDGNSGDGWGLLCEQGRGSGGFTTTYLSLSWRTVKLGTIVVRLNENYWNTCSACRIIIKS